MNVAFPIIRMAAWGIREETVEEYFSQVEMKSMKDSRPGRLFMALWKASSVVQVREASMPPSVRALRSIKPPPWIRALRMGIRG